MRQQRQRQRRQHLTLNLNSIIQSSYKCNQIINYVIPFKSYVQNWSYTPMKLTNEKRYPIFKNMLHILKSNTLTLCHTHGKCTVSISFDLKAIMCAEPCSVNRITRLEKPCGFRVYVMHINHGQSH